MILAMLMMLAVSACLFGTGSAAALGGASGAPQEDAGLRRLRAHAARAMVLAWCTGEREEKGPEIFSAAMAHARGMNETRAMLVAADHLLAVREMESGLERWRRGGR